MVLRPRGLGRPHLSEAHNEVISKQNNTLPGAHVTQQSGRVKDLVSGKCGVDSIPGPGTFIRLGGSQKNKGTKVTENSLIFCLDV